MNVEKIKKEELPEETLVELLYIFYQIAETSGILKEIKQQADNDHAVHKEFDNAE